jgi:hypothetical protein
VANPRQTGQDSESKDDEAKFLAVETRGENQLKMKDLADH